MQKVIPPVVVDGQQRYAIPEAAALLRQSRAKLYEDIAADRIHVIKDGRRTYVHGSEIIRRSRAAA
jgi:hypothetical protein